MSLFSAFATDVAIDLGTANTCVFARGRGIVLNEPSIVAYNIAKGSIEAVGTEAHEMLGRTPANIKPVRPMKDGVIADFDAAEKMLMHFVRKVQGKKPAAPPAPRHRRAARDHAGRAPRGQGQRLPRQGERSAPRRRADGGGDRLGAAGDRSGRQHDHRHRRRHDRHRRHLAGRHRLRPIAARRGQRARRSDHSVHAPGAQPADRRAHGGADQVRARIGGAARSAADDGSEGPSPGRRRAAHAEDFATATSARRWPSRSG